MHQQGRVHQHEGVLNVAGHKQQNADCPLAGHWNLILPIFRYLDFPRSEAGLNLLSSHRSESTGGVEYQCVVFPSLNSKHDCILYMVY